MPGSVAEGDVGRQERVSLRIICGPRVKRISASRKSGIWVPSGAAPARVRWPPVVAQLARVAHAHGIALAALDGRGDGLAADGHCDHLLHVGNVQAVARDGGGR
jgi:hypothetical protein